MKDVPSDMPPGMTLAAMLPRADPHDAFVSLRHASFEQLPQGARVGTSSLRRQCQLKYARPDLQLLTLRGNVETRLRKLQEDQYDAIILAAAGLIRLGLEDRITHRFDLPDFVPAVGQGIIGIECRADDARSIALVRALNDELAWQCCEAERAFALRLQGSCQSPIAGHATIAGGRVQLRGVVGSPDGQRDLSRRAGRRSCRHPRSRHGIGGSPARRRCAWAARKAETRSAVIPKVLPPLTDLTVLVTRPAAQCAVLCEEIVRQGGNAIAFPAVAIEPLAVQATVASVDYDLIVFVSVNAVEHGARHVTKGARTRIAAIGRATAAALAAAELAADIVPEAGFTSEALLAHPELQLTSGARVLIVRGAGGRELLKETFVGAWHGSRDARGLPARTPGCRCSPARRGRSALVGRRHRRGDRDQHRDPGEPAGDAHGARTTTVK